MRQRKLLVVPGACDALGGTLVTLSLLIKGFVEQGKMDSIKVAVRADSVMEQYLKAAGQERGIEIIPVRDKRDFLRTALAWVDQQPLDWPLLLDNCVERSLLSNLILSAPKLRLSGRPIYHFCHDLALSYNTMGYWSRKLAFSLLSPKAICNSNFTKHHIQTFMPKVVGVLYQPVDLEEFKPRLQSHEQSPPPSLLPILATGARIMLTPSRISPPGIINDKNLRGLIPVLAKLKQKGAYYHGVIIGEDRSPEQANSKVLEAEAERLGVADRFTILPPTFEIADFYRFADVVVSLAPREPFGRFVVEAIACGVPVVGSNVGGIGEILSQVSPNWQVTPDSPAEIAQKILHVEADPQTQTILQTAKSWVEEYCSVTRYTQDIMKLTGVAEYRENYASTIPNLVR
jgi:glycosyltransferase involved in cell wall biosynthesis